MRHLIEDHWAFRLPVDVKTTKWIGAEAAGSDLYTAKEIQLLRRVPPPPKQENVIPAKARRDEILAEWDRWINECEDVAERTGLNAADAAVDALVTEQAELAHRIVALPTQTLAGMRVRALILKAIIEEDGEDEYGQTREQLLILSIVRDILVMS